MINGLHAMIYTQNAEADRAFFRDVLKFPHVDAGDGWLIFAAPPSEIGFHPADDAPNAPVDKHDLHFMCDDVYQTVIELKARGVQFIGEPVDHGYGIVITLKLPGGGTIDLYQPRHPRPPKSH